MTNSSKSEQVPPEQPAPPSPEKPPASMHDTFVYKMLSDPVLAAAEFKLVLPQEVSNEIDWEKLEQDTNRFVDEKLDNQYTDLLFKTTLRGQKIRLRLLLEHSSHPKQLDLLQTLRYQVRQWERDAHQKREVHGGLQRLTPIITIILHHSETGWRGRNRFIDYFGLDDDLGRLLRPYVVDFGIVVDDISKVNTEALIQRPVPLEVQVMLFALRYGRTGRKVLDELPKIAPLLAVLLQGPNGRLVLGLFFLYIKRVAKVSEAEMRTALQDLIEPHLDPEMVAMWTQFEAGEKKGKLEMARSMLQRLVTQRFGALSPAAIARLESATLVELDAMTLRVLTATNVDEVLST